MRSTGAISVPVAKAKTCPTLYCAFSFLHCRVQQARRKFLRVVNLVCAARLEAFGNNKTQHLSNMHLCRSWRKTSPRKRRKTRTKLRTLEIINLSVMSYEPVLPHCAVIDPCVCLPAPAASPSRQKTAALCGPRDWPLLLLRSLPEENHGRLASRLFS